MSTFTALGPPLEIIRNPVLGSAIQSCWNGISMEGREEYGNNNALVEFCVEKQNALLALAEQKSGDVLAQGVVALLSQDEVTEYHFPLSSCRH